MLAGRLALTNRRAGCALALARRTAARQAGAPAARPAAAAANPPKFELVQGKKWIVEHQVGNRELIIDDCSPKMSVYVYGCKDSVIQIKGKVNNIVLDSCKKTGLVFADAMASFEAVNCQSVQVQVTGRCPTFAVDKTDGFQLYLSEECMDAAITTAKSSEMNVTVPAAEEGDDPVETPLPEQFITKYEKGAWVTVPVEHAA